MNEQEEADVFIGEVIFFIVERGFGFISWKKDGVPQTDMFCHFSDIELDGFKLLKAEQKVSFSVGVNNSGQPKAINVKII
jgi:CspA family cold shock protein